MSDPNERPDDREGHATPTPWQQEGVEECSAGAEQTQFQPGDVEAGVEEAEGPMDDDLHGPYQGEPIPIVISPEDGLPVPTDASHELQLAHRFTYEMICVADDREFLEVTGKRLMPIFPNEAAPTRRFGGPSGAKAWRTFVGSASGPRLRCPASGVYVLMRDPFTDDGVEIEQLRFGREDKLHRWGVSVALLTPPHVEQLLAQGTVLPPDALDAKVYVVIEPRRPECLHYKRSVFANDSAKNKTDVGHKIVYRNCEARRTVGGATMKLGDELVYCCEWRNPPDPASVEQHIGAWDRQKLDDGERPPEMVPLLGLPDTTGGSSSQG